jgi:hypothetical protein
MGVQYNKKLTLPGLLTGADQSKAKKTEGKKDTCGQDHVCPWNCLFILVE